MNYQEAENKELKADLKKALSHIKGAMAVSAVKKNDYLESKLAQCETMITTQLGAILVKEEMEKSR